MPMSSKRPGRRPGTSSARDDILASARKLFSLNGIDKTSIRAIASDAGVDPALVHHYFGTKLDLFREVVQLPVDPSVVLQPLRDVPVDELGVTIPRLIIALWDSELGANMLAVFRSALTGADDGLVRVFFREVLVNIIAERVDSPPVAVCCVLNSRSHRWPASWWAVTSWRSNRWPHSLPSKSP
ncbi:bacterial regulatory s, tetR family protein [Mycobacteroides abscessus MAB_082312_2258]|nr:bacterial regulatory s, tetR family protein [Mycobacteroides abscessus MAB_082312_2258]